MADISKCQNDKCDIKEQCYRHTAISSPYGQSYFVMDKEVKKESDCEYFWDNE